MTAMNQQTSEQLARLWTESQPVVAAYVLSIIPNFHQAEDVLQQVAVALVSEFERFDASRPFLGDLLVDAVRAAAKGINLRGPRRVLMPSFDDCR